MIRSLRLRLLVGTSLATAVVLSLLGVGIYVSMRRSLLAEYDEAILTQAKALASMTEQRQGRVWFEFDAQEMPEFSANHHPEYFEIWIDNGGTLARSDSLSDGHLARPMPPASASFQDAALPDGRQGRWVTLAFTPLMEQNGSTRPSANARTGVVTVARDIRPLRHTLSRLWWLLLSLCSVATLVSGAVLMIVVGKILRPVRRLAQNIESFGETDLAHRFDPACVPTELAPIVDRLNGLLGRLEAAFGREKNFTADVAHELRTPLAGLHTTLEVCRSRIRDNREYEAVLDKCGSITSRMQEMVQRLLLLARADSRQLTVQSEPLGLRLLLDESWRQFRPRAEVRRLNVHWEVPDGCGVLSDPDLLLIVIDNLFDNAVSYADEGGRIEIRAQCIDPYVELMLSNTGSEVAAVDMPRVFDRFWRGDNARSDNGVHSGLGLSLCERLTRLLNGRLTVKTERGGLFIVRLLLAPTANSAVSGKTVS